MAKRVASHHIVSVRRDMLIELDAAYDEFAGAVRRITRDAVNDLPACTTDCDDLECFRDLIETFLIHHKQEEVR